MAAPLDLEVLGKIAEGDDFVVHEIRWQAFGDVCGEGLWLAHPNAKESMIVIPDADQTPEEIAGFDDKVPTDYQTAREYAADGINVFVPVLINRDLGPHKI